MPGAKTYGMYVIEGIKEVKKMAIDPICKMTVDENTAKHKAEYKGKTYYFCAPGCKSTFEKSPEKYLEGGAGVEMHMHEMKDKPWWKFW